VNSFATVWAISALILMTIIQAVYFLIFFMIFYVIGWGILQVLKPIVKILYKT
jgi:hypothetical protein